MYIVSDRQSPLTAEEAAERVRKGAAWLDTKDPHWHEKINLSRVDVGSGVDCIVAQLHNGHFSAGMRAWDPMGRVDLYKHGFMGSTVTDDRTLNHQWRTLILRRMHGELPLPSSRLRAFLRRVLPFAA